MSKKSSFALVIPCYNEEKAVRNFSAELLQFRDQFAKNFPQLGLNIIIVDNNSIDESVQLLKRSLLNCPELKIESCTLQGYGAALKYGFQSQDVDFYAFADLDNTYPLQALIPMLKFSLDGDIDMISGGRLNSLSEIPVVRRLGNIFYSQVTRSLFWPCPIVDTCSGMRIFKASLRDQVVKLKENDLSFSIELTAHALKNRWKLKEYPISYRERIGASKLSVVADGFKFLYILISKKFSYAK